MPSEIGIMRTAFRETRRTLSSCRGARPRAPLPPPLHTGWHASDGHAPDALDPPPPEDLSPPEAWRPRDGAVLRAHDVQPHVDEVCLALTWRSFLGFNFCSPNRGCRHARSHCSAAHDVPPLIGRDNKTLSAPIRYRAGVRRDRIL